MRKHPLLLGALLAALACAPAAQVPAATSTASATYRFGGDTLRFREVSEGQVRITLPQGQLAFRTTHDGTVAISRAGGDTARAWYEALAIGIVGPGTGEPPATGEVLRQPFTLRMDDRGRVTVLATPTFPASFKGVSDLTRQFDDFFPRLPAQPLVVGATWSDTADRAWRSGEQANSTRAVAHYRVERDTVVAGTPAVVVSMRQELTIRGEGPTPNGPATSTQAGTENGFFVFAPRTGRLLARRREARLEGGYVIGAGDAQVTMPQVFSYTSRIDALP